MKKSRILAAAVIAGAALAGSAAPALASTAMFRVTVNGNAEVTRYPVTDGQVITCDGKAVTIQSVQGSYGTYTITTTPRLTASETCSA